MRSFLYNWQMSDEQMSHFITNDWHKSDELKSYWTMGESLIDLSFLIGKCLMSKSLLFSGY